MVVMDSHDNSLSSNGSFLWLVIAGAVESRRKAFSQHKDEIKSEGKE